MKNELIAASPAIRAGTDPAYRIVLLYWPSKKKFSVHNEVYEEGETKYDTGNWFDRVDDALPCWFKRMATRFETVPAEAIRPLPLYRIPQLV